MSNYTIKQLQTDLATKKISPAEIWDFYQTRTQKYNPQLNAFIHLNERPTDFVSTGPLAGLPLGLKDIFCSTDSPSTAGSEILQGFTAPYDATVVSRLKQAGAYIFGKTNTDEFAMGASTENSCYGPTLNPYDLTRVAGGSSGGSAAAVSADLCLAATGSDTGGSIRQPAAFCGCTGLKPSYGRTSRSGIMAMASSLDTIGCFTKTAEDAAIMLEQMAGDDPHDSTTQKTPPPTYTTHLIDSIAGQKIGVPAEYFSEDIDAEIREKVKDALLVWEKLGAKIVPISLPHTKYAVAVYYIIVPAEVSSNMARYDGIRFGPTSTETDNLLDFYQQNRSRFGAEVKRRIMIGTYTLSAGHYDAYYARAVAVKNLIRQEFIQAFKEVDVIIAPTTPTTAFPVNAKASPLDMYLADILTIPASLAGVCSLAIPCGFDHQHLPVGLQIIGGHDQEKTILNFGHLYQQNTDWHRQPPTLT